jgi:hypothetical protein
MSANEKIALAAIWIWNTSPSMSFDAAEKLAIDLYEKNQAKK